MAARTLPNGNGSPPAGVIAPPHNLDAEQSVLGAIRLSDRSLYALVIEEGLRPEDFYRERHGAIYEAMLSLYEDSLCPYCRKFEQTFGATVDKLIDTGAVAADYYMVAILDRPNRDYSSRAGRAAYCVADQSIGKAG